MSRTLSTFSQKFGHFEYIPIQVVFIASIDHPELQEPFRIVDYDQDVQHLGDTYTALPFVVTPPADRSEGINKAQLRLANVNRWLTPTIRALKAHKLEVTLKMVTLTNNATDPLTFDEIEWEWPAFDVLTISDTEAEVQLTLSHERIQAQKFPRYTINRFDFPGAF